MARDPLTIVNEFRDHPDARVRRNVVAALGAIESPASLERLLEIATEDRDGSVSANAATEAARVATVGADQKEAAEKWFAKRLEPPDKPARPKKKDRLKDKAEQARLAAEANRAKEEWQEGLKKVGRVSSLAARLRSLGFPIPRRKAQLAERLESSFWNRQAALKERGRIGVRQLVSATVGAMFGGLVGVLALMALDPQPSIAVAAYALPFTLILAPFLGSLLNDRSTHTSTYHDPGAGAVWEVLIVGFWTFLAAVVIVTVVVLSWPDVANLDWSLRATLLLLGGVAGTMLFLLGVRAGTMIATHTAGPEFFRRLVRSLCGFGLGSLLLTGTFKGLGLIAVGKGAEDALTPLAALWLLLLCSGVGIAAAMATQYPQRPTTLGRRGVFGCRLLSAAIILAALAPIAWYFMASDFGWPAAVPGKLRELPETRFAGLPASTRFSLDFPQAVRIEAHSERDDDLVICVTGGDLVAPIVRDDSLDAPEIFQGEFAEGTYAAELRFYYDYFQEEFDSQQEAQAAQCRPREGQNEAEDANLRPRHHFFSAARLMVAAGLRSEESVTEETGPYVVQVSLNVEPARALQRQVQAFAERNDLTAASSLLTAVAEQGGELDLLPARDALCRIGSLRGRARQVAPTCAQLEDAAPDHPDSADLKDTLGIHYARLGEHAKAKAAFEEFISQSADDSLGQIRKEWIEDLDAKRDPFKDPRAVDAVVRGDERFRMVGASKEEKLEALITDGLRYLFVEDPERIDVDEARRFLNGAVALEPALESQTRYFLCVFGALSEGPEVAVRLCDDADPRSQLSHGVALARAGANELAIGKLESWEEYSGDNQRREIAALSEGRNPFDEGYIRRRLTSRVRDLGDPQDTLRFQVQQLLAEAIMAGSEE